MKLEEVKEYFFKYEEFIPQYDEFAQKVLTPSSQGFVVNTLKISVEALMEKLSKYKELEITQFEDRNYYFFETKEDFNLGKTIEHNLGYFYIMGISSFLAADKVNITKAGIVDFCAAPGGKSFVLAHKLKNKHLLIANELKKGRCRVLRAQLSKFAIANTVVLNTDAAKLNLKRKFDSILLDGPCSAEGTMRGQFQVMKKWKKDDKFRENLHRTQKAILFNAFEHLNVGGEMIYSTCTYDPMENELPIDHLLQEKSAKLLPLEIAGSCDGLTKYKDFKFHESLCLARRFYPHFLDSWGFFVARITKC